MIRFKTAAKKVTKAKGPRGRKPTHTEFIKFRIAPDLLDKLDKAAKANGDDRSAAFRKGAELYIKAKG